MLKFRDVDTFLSHLGADRRAQVLALRELILASNPGLTEHIKWNSPSYIWNGEDRITFNLHKDKLRLVLHCGVTIKEDKKAPRILDDDIGLLEWNSNIRATLSFRDLQDIDNKREQVISILRRWLAVVLE